MASSAPATERRIATLERGRIYTAKELRREHDIYASVLSRALRRGWLFRVGRGRYCVWHGAPRGARRTTTTGPMEILRAFMTRARRGAPCWGNHDGYGSYTCGFCSSTSVNPYDGDEALAAMEHEEDCPVLAARRLLA